MPLPNTSGVMNAGVNPNDVSQKNDISQVMNNFFREFSARMDNILNVRGNVQAGVFNAFGNNVITRGGTQVTDLLTDTLKDLFAEKEEPTDDPTVKALKAQFEVLTEISKTMLKVNQDISSIDETAYQIRLDIKNQFAKQSNQTQRKINIGEDSDNLVFPKLENPVTSGDSMQLSQKQDYVFGDLLRRESIDSATDISETVEEQKHQTTTLQKILDVLLSSDKKLDKMVKDKPLTTREEDIDAKRLRAGTGLADQLSGKSTQHDFSGLLLSGLGAIVNGLKDFGIALLAFKALFSKIPGMILKSFTSIFAAVRTQIPVLFNTIKSMFTKGFGGILGSLSIALAPLMAMLGIKTWAEQASIRDESGELTSTGAVLDTIQRSTSTEQGLKPLSDMTDVERIASNAETGFMGLNSAKKESYRKKYRESIDRGAEYSQPEAEALLKHFSITVPETQIKKVQTDVSAGVTGIEQGQIDLQKVQKSSVVPMQQNRPVMQNNNTTNNQTIMPTRSFPTNTEPGYRRYMDNMLQGG